MPRKIEYRGLEKRDDDKKIWHYGNLTICDNGDYLITDCKKYGYTIYQIQVVPETVGQYTGLKDINGKEIYEGGIVKWGHLGGWHSENPVRIAIVKINPDIQFDCINLHTTFEYGNFAYKDTQNAVEIIGNIYGNPELLKEADHE